MRFASKLSTIVLCLVAGACTRTTKLQKIQPVNQEPTSTEATLVVTGDRMGPLKEQAIRLGLNVTGDQVLLITGATAKLKELDTPADANALAAWDEPVGIERSQSARRSGDHSDETVPDDAAQPVNYLARDEFGIPAWLANHPTHDGRGVKVGIVDDGISPFQSGFRTTTTGQRKFIGFSNASTRLDLALTPSLSPATPLPGFAASVSTPFAKAWTGTYDEAAAKWSSTSNDLNADGTNSSIALAVFEGLDGSFKICVDSNVNAIADAGECFGSFAATGEFGYWNSTKTMAVMGEFNPTTAILKLSDGEALGDSHGEGVASVLAGHNIGGQFDGVAPGAQILDFDISAGVTSQEENLYTISTFLRALDWLGGQGAEVCNISYSLFFYSAASQSFMKKSLDSLVARYGFVISFSAGNNGPGISSFNRGLIYPDNSLVAAAYVSKAMDERVHGVTGLPNEGRIIWYSSVGPSPDGGTTPTVASPLASLTHSDALTGFTAFSGTSSASPALAGFATVLISAVKQENLPVKVDLIVNAIRLSGKSIPSIPYVQQGAGVPQIDRALDAYRTLLLNKGFVRVDSTIDGTGPDGVRRTGILARTSQVSGTQEYRVRLKGIPSSLSNPADSSELLTPVRLVYSHPWLVGSDRSFLSIGGSALTVSIDFNAIVSQPERGATHFADIRVINDITGELIKIIPVTVIDDVLISQPLDFTRTMGPEEGTSVHFYVPAGVTGVKADLRLVSGDARYAIFRSYDPSSKIISTYRGTSVDNIWIPTPIEGWYQLGVAKYNGTAAPLQIAGRLTPVKIAVASPVLRVEGTDSGVFKVFNGTADALDARIQVKPAAINTQSKLLRKLSSELAQNAWTITSPGFYSPTAAFSDRADVTYPSPGCYILGKDSHGAVVEVIEFGAPYEVTAGSPIIGGTIELSCRPFETPTGGIGSGTTTSLTWTLTLEQFAQSPTTVLGESVVRIASGTTEQHFRWLETQTILDPASYRIELSQPTVPDHGSFMIGMAQTL